MATDITKLIDLDGLTTFKAGTDAKYETKSTVSALATRVKALEDDDSAANTLEIVKVNGSALTPDANKAVNINNIIHHHHLIPFFIIMLIVTFSQR